MTPYPAAFIRAPLRRRALAASLTLIALAAGLSTSSGAATKSSGIRGYVTISGCPGPERVEGNCTEPYAAAITVRRRSDYKRITTIHSSGDGRFRIRVRPDRYVLEPQPRQGLPFAVPVIVKVRSRRFTFVQIEYDRGLNTPTTPGAPEPAPQAPSAG